MTGANPYLEAGSELVDQRFGTNLSGRDENRNDFSTWLGRIAFPTSRAHRYVGQQLQEKGPAALEQIQQIMPNMQ